MDKTSQFRALVLLCVLAGCAAKDDDDDGDSGDTSAGSSGTDAGTATTDPMPTGTDAATSDTEGGNGECDPRAQDCPEGLKCTAYGKMAGDEWNANKCVDEPNNGGVAGDPCEIMGADMFTGIDTCAKGYICQNPDEELKNGACVEFCKPDDSCPNTSGGMAPCLPANDGKLPICLASCNPLIQDCPGQQACYGDPSGPPFFCYGPDPKNGGTDGAKCGFTNDCLAGLHCADAATVEGCTGDATACCTPFCALDEMACTGMEMCSPFFPTPQPGYENVGICVLP